MEEAKEAKIEETPETAKTSSKNIVVWAKHIAAAIIGAIISFATAFGLLSKPEGEIAKEATDAAIEKSEQAYVQVTSVSNSIVEIKKLIDDKKYVEAISKLDDIGKNTKGAIESVSELKQQLGTIVKLVKKDKNSDDAEGKKEGENE